jgi:hypothetical protein
MLKDLEGGSLAEELEYFNNTLALFDQYGISYCAFAGPPWAWGSTAPRWALVYANQPNYAPTAAGQILKHYLANAVLP